MSCFTIENALKRGGTPSSAVSIQLSNLSSESSPLITFFMIKLDILTVLYETSVKITLLSHNLIT